MTEDKVKEVFPAAERVLFVKQGDWFTGLVKVYFATEEAALEASAKAVTVDGTPISVNWAGVATRTWDFTRHISRAFYFVLI